MYKLLVIDDEKKILEGICDLFPWKEIGFEIVGRFTRARDGWEDVRNNPVDVVLTDIEMPDMTGLELCEKLAKESGILAVLFSSYTNYEYFRSAIQIGVEDYLVKPVKYAQLLECFGKVKEKLDAKYQKKVEHPKAYYEQIVSDVTDYLKQNYKNASLEEAAAAVNLSPTYLSRIFKEKSGANFSEILQKIRMEKAAELLGDIQYKTYEVAWNVGYDNPKNFSRAFRSYYHLTPSEYRKRTVNEKYEHGAGEEDET